MVDLNDTGIARKPIKWLLGRLVVEEGPVIIGVAVLSRWLGLEMLVFNGADVGLDFGVSLAEHEAGGRFVKYACYLVVGLTCSL
jgi:hypothetical protein